MTPTFATLRESVALLWVFVVALCFYVFFLGARVYDLRPNTTGNAPEDPELLSYGERLKARAAKLGVLLARYELWAEHLSWRQRAISQIVRGELSDAKDLMWQMGEFDELARIAQLSLRRAADTAKRHAEYEPWPDREALDEWSAELDESLVGNELIDEVLTHWQTRFDRWAQRCVRFRSHCVGEDMRLPAIGIVADPDRPSALRRRDPERFRRVVALAALASELEGRPSSEPLSSTQSQARWRACAAMPAVWLAVEEAEVAAAFLAHREKTDDIAQLEASWGPVRGLSVALATLDIVLQEAEAAFAERARGLESS